MATTASSWPMAPTPAGPSHAGPCASVATASRAHNRAWVQQHALFEPCVQRFLARLRELQRAMNILLVNHYAGSPALGMEYRPYYLAREWVRAGSPRADPGRRLFACARAPARARWPRSRLRRELIDGIAYRWLPTPRYESNGVGRRAQHLGLPARGCGATRRACSASSRPTWSSRRAPTRWTSGSRGASPAPGARRAPSSSTRCTTCGR